jgi:DNA-binding transcriptional ArsR family regulator
MIGQVPDTQTRDLPLRAKFFRGLADPSRLALLEALRDGEHTVGELMAATGLSQSNASGHLACLRECGLVASRQEWRHVYYRLAGPAVEHLLAAADLVLSSMADRLAACGRPETGDRGER